eukprot:jgi/Chlat1/1179/Chrsp114S01645
MCRNEVELTTQVVHWVCQKLSIHHKPVATVEAVDIHARSAPVIKRLETHTVVGLLGMRGVGKTTIAKHVYNYFVADYCGRSCFITLDPGESTVALKEQQRAMLRALCKTPADDNVGLDLSDGRQLLTERLRNEQVLLVVDNVTTKEQADYLLVPVAAGSKVILTSWERRWLEYPGNVEILQVSCLGPLDAITLFCRHAYRQHTRKEQDEFAGIIYNACTDEFNLSDYFLCNELHEHVCAAGERGQSFRVCAPVVKSIVEACGGLPLALQVIGSALRNQSRVEFLHYLERLPEMQSLHGEKEDGIFSILEFSLTRLGSKERDAFQDLACYPFLRTYSGYRAGVYIWTSPGDLADLRRGIPRVLLNLQESSLISVEEHPEIAGRLLVMHDLLVILGTQLKKTVAPQQLSCLQPSTLHHVSGIPQQGEFSEIQVELNRERVAPDEFGPGLRLLAVNCASYLVLQGSAQHLVSLQVNMLRNVQVIEAAVYNKLYALDLSLGSFEQLWDAEANIQLPSLQTLVLTRCGRLVILPDINKFTNLQMLDLAYCVSLTSLTAPTVVCLKLPHLLFLSLDFCSKLRAIPNLELPKLKHWRSIDVDCNPEGLLQQVCKMKDLRYLILCNTRLASLPANELWELHHLEVLDVSQNDLVEVPQEVNRLQQLKKLVLDSNKLNNLPELSLQHLEELRIWGNNLLKVPEHIRNCKKLVWHQLEAQLEREASTNFRRVATMFQMAKSKDRLPACDEAASCIMNAMHKQLRRYTTDAALSTWLEELQEKVRVCRQQLQHKPLPVDALTVLVEGLDVFQGILDKQELNGLLDIVEETATQVGSAKHWKQLAMLGPRIAGGWVKCSGERRPHELGICAFDGHVQTKWLAFRTGEAWSSWLSYTFKDDQEHVVEAYCVTSANDCPDRDPACWELRGSMNANANEDSNSEWFALDVQTDRKFSGRFTPTEILYIADHKPCRKVQLLVKSISAPPPIPENFSVGLAVQLSKLDIYTSVQRKQL